MQFTASSLALLATLTISVTASPINRAAVQTSNNPTAVVRRALTKRNNLSVACGLWATGNIADIGSGLGEDADQVTVSANSCGRIGCYDTSGVYVCNDQGVEITIPMQEAIDQVAYLKSLCHKSNGEGYYFGSGQVFSDNFGGYNLNIGYCNTNHPNNAKPSDYEFPGPNGNPSVTCGGNSGVPCEGASCIDGTIKINKQESINKDDFLGPAYAGAGSTATYQTTRTIGETWTAGGFLSIDTSDLAPVSVQAGFFSSYAKTTTTGSAAGITADCGNSTEGDYTCAMHISPRYQSIEGTCETAGLGTVPYAVIAPQTRSQDGQADAFYGICVCPNCPDANNPLAPENTCPMDCATCDPNVQTS